MLAIEYAERIHPHHLNCLGRYAIASSAPAAGLRRLGEVPDSRKRHGQATASLEPEGRCTDSVGGTHREGIPVAIAENPTNLCLGCGYLGVLGAAGDRAAADDDPWA
jgi:hypothetical protein